MHFAWINYIVVLIVYEYMPVLLCWCFIAVRLQYGRLFLLCDGDTAFYRFIGWCLCDVYHLVVLSQTCILTVVLRYGCPCTWFNLLAYWTWLRSGLLCRFKPMSCKHILLTTNGKMPAFWFRSICYYMQLILTDSICI